MMKRKSSMFTLIGVVVFSAVFAQAKSIPVANGSFEIPAIDPNENINYAMGIVSLWREVDQDPYGFAIGTFHNKPADSNDHIVNIDGKQAAFVNSQNGNALEQEMEDVYRVGRRYRLTIGICPSLLYPPASTDSLSLGFRYLYFSAVPADIISAAVYGNQLTQNQLAYFSLTLPTVKPTDPWARKNIGIAFRTAGSAGKYWDLDNIRLAELAGDLTEDGIVNLSDMSILSAQWLSCDNPTADITGDGCVNLNDVLLMSEYWLDSF